MRDAHLQITKEGVIRRMALRQGRLPRILLPLLPQLFACLVVREQQRKSYRDTETLLRDAEHWGRSIGMKRTPDLPKLSMAVASHSHFVVAAIASLGRGGDQPFLPTLLTDAVRRTRVRTLVADAGYDSEVNHELAREPLQVRSIIPPNAGRPTAKLPPTRYRRLMKHRFARRTPKRTGSDGRSKRSIA